MSTLCEPLSSTTLVETGRGGVLRWLLTGYIVFLPVQIETPQQLRFAPSDLFLAVALFLGLRVWRIRWPAWTGWHAALLGLFAVSLVAVLLTHGSVSQYVLLNKMAGLVLLFGSYLALTSLADSWGDWRWFLKAFVVSVTLQNAVNVVAFLWCRVTGADDPWLDILLSSGLDRLAGMLVDANAYGGLLIVAYAVVLLDGHSDQALLGRRLRLFSLATLSLGLLLTSSRSAWLGLAVLTLFGVCRSPRLLFVVALTAVIGIGMMAYFAGAENFDALLTVSARQNTIDERIELSENALRLFARYPLLGGGIGAFVEEHDQIIHNTALWFLAEFGLVGVIVLIGFLCSFLVNAWAAYRVAEPHRRALLAGLVAAHLAMIGFSLGVEALYQRWWWLVMALLASAHTLALRNADAASGATTGIASVDLDAGFQHAGVSS